MTTWATTAVSWATSQALSLFGRSWQYRTLTSAVDAETATYSGLTTFTAQAVGLSQSLSYDDKAHDYRKVTRQTIKCADTVSLKIGDQVVDPAGKHWHVAEVQDAADIDGAKRYVVERAIDVKGTDQSRGGV